jgi:YVTN family beta-propeller protein
MKICSISAWLAAVAFAGLLGSVQALAQNAYITNSNSNNVSVIDTETNTVIATIGVGISPFGVAVTPDGGKAYVANAGSNSVSVIDTATDTVSATIPSQASLAQPIGVAVTPDGSKVYVTNTGGILSMIDAATNMVTLEALVQQPIGVAVTPDGSKVYVADVNSNSVSVVDTTTHTVSAIIPVGATPEGVAVTPDGTKVYVANSDSNSVSVIDTTTDRVSATTGVGAYPVAFGVFIQPPARFAGTPGKANCLGQSVAALAGHFGGLNHAAAALGFSGVTALQSAILAYCRE